MERLLEFKSGLVRRNEDHKGIGGKIWIEVLLMEWGWFELLEGPYVISLVDLSNTRIVKAVINMTLFSYPSKINGIICTYA